jgi:hypothetical protein
VALWPTAIPAINPAATGTNGILRMIDGLLFTDFFAITIRVFKVLKALNLLRRGSIGRRERSRNVFELGLTVKL